MPEAIQEDVSNEEEVSKTPRDEVLDDIAKRRQQQLDGEVIPTDEPEEIDEELTEEQKYQIKVNGEETEVGHDEVIEAGIRTLQKESAADKKLEEASKLLKEAKEQASRFEEFEPPPEEPEYDGQSDAAKIAHAMQYGSDEEAAEAVEKLMAQRNATDPNELVSQAKMQIEHENAMSRFQDEFSDVWEDENLRAIAVAQENKMRDDGDDRDFWTVRKEVGENVRKWRDSHKPTESGLDAKRKRKGSIDTPSGASAPMESKQAESDEAPSNSEVLAQMAKARGKVY